MLKSSSGSYHIEPKVEYIDRGGGELNVLRKMSKDCGEVYKRGSLACGDVGLAATFRWGKVDAPT